MIVSTVHANSSIPLKRFTSKGSANASQGSELHHCSFVQCKGQLRYRRATGLSKTKPPWAGRKQSNLCCLRLLESTDNWKPGVCTSSTSRTMAPNPHHAFLAQSTIFNLLILPVDHPSAFTLNKHKMMEMAFLVPSCYSQEFAHEDVSLWQNQLIPLSHTTLQRLHKATSFSKHGSSSLQRH